MSDNIKVVDMHCHILPKVDDGAYDLNESLQMLSIGKCEGVSKIVLTPHFKNYHKNVSNKRLIEFFELFNKHILKLGYNIDLYLGSEVMYYQDMLNDLKQGLISTMNNTKYVLIEFIPSVNYSTMLNALEEVAANGYKPILAHIERYDCLLNHIEYVIELSNRGFKLQVNASSIVGESGSKVKHFTYKVLDRGLVNYLASDCHSSIHRPPLFKKCLKQLNNRYTEEYINSLVYLNAINDFNLK